MKNLIKILSVAIIFVLLTSNINAININKNTSQTIYVDDDGCKDYLNIQDAIENANENDTIFVYNGTYNETINIDKPLFLIGENSTETIIDGEYNRIIVNVSASNVSIEKFTIRNSNGHQGNSGIKINDDYTQIKNCIVYQTKSGIYIKNSSKNTIDNCTFQKNGEGIFLESSDNNLIEGCNFNHNSIGINLDNSSYNNIKFCYLHTNGIASYLNNSKNSLIYHCNISDNSVNIGGIFLISCKDLDIQNCNLYHNGAGLCVYSSKNLSINKCNFYLNTHFAVSLRTYSEDITISECKIIDNNRYGLYIEENNKCKLRNNNIYNNKLFSVKVKNAICDAKNNWWGSKFGPSLTNLRKTSRVTWLPLKTKYFPWSSESLENIGSDWNENLDYMLGKKFELPDFIVKLPGNDTDSDGVPDWWEEKWGYNTTSWDDHLNLDPDGDALNNFEECYTDKYESNPFEKDVFLEIDWMPCLVPEEENKPSLELIEELVKVFADHEINLHVDLGELDGGGEIPYCTSKFSFAKLRDLYWDYFLNNNLTNPRKGIFHYGIICSYCPDLNFPFFGWDGLDSFAVSSEWLKDIFPFTERDNLIVGASLHHLGHTLGLLADTFGGIDNLGTSQPLDIQWWKYRNYKSSMNYRYKYKIFSYSDGDNGPGDFNDWENLDFSFFKDTNFIK